MYSDDMRRDARTIQGRNLDECKRLLYAQYGKRYNIVD